MRKNGPIGTVFDSWTTLSISLTSIPSSSCTFQISDTDELRIRLTTKPGASPHLIGVFLICWAKFAAAWTVSGDVSSPSITSIRRIIDAG